MRKANKSFISLAVILIAGLSITVTAFADPLSIGIGLPIAEATGISIGISGMSPSGADAWFNTTSGSDPVQLQTNYIDVDLVNDVPIKYRKNNNNTVDFQIDRDSSIFKYFNNSNNLYTAGALHEFIANNNIQVDQTDTNIYDSKALDGFPFNSVVAVLPYGNGTYNLPCGVVCQVTGSPAMTMVFSYNNSTQQTGSFSAYRWPFQISYVYIDQTHFAIRYKSESWDARTNSFSVAQASDIDDAEINYGSGHDFIYDGNGDQFVHITVPESLLHNLQLANLFGDLTGEDFIDLTEDIGDIITDATARGQLYAEYSDEDIGGDPPVPPVPPTPLPTTPIGEVPFDNWVDLWGATVTEKQDETNEKLDFIGSNGHDQLEELEQVNTNLQETNDTLDNIDTNVGDIADHVENIDTNIDTMADDISNIDTNVADIAEHVENIDTNVEDIEDIAGNIDTNIGIGNGLLGDIKSAAESAVEFLEGIAEHVEELVEEIVEGTETLIAGILNQIPSVFGVIFGPIKQASSIWHYVVEWIQSISAPMSWIWTMASGTSYNIILPVYASLAAAVVLAFYKRFGK